MTSGPAPASSSADHLGGQRVLEAGDVERQHVEPLGPAGGDQGVDDGGVPGLDQGTIENDGGDGAGFSLSVTPAFPFFVIPAFPLFVIPAKAGTHIAVRNLPGMGRRGCRRFFRRAVRTGPTMDPCLRKGTGGGRLIHPGGRQRLRFAPLGFPAEQKGGITQELSGVVGAAVDQILPQPMRGILGQGGQRRQLGIGLGVAGQPGDRDAARPRRLSPPLRPHRASSHARRAAAPPPVRPARSRSRRRGRPTGCAPGAAARPGAGSAWRRRPRRPGRRTGRRVRCRRAESTTMRAGVCPRSTASDPSDTAPGVAARRCMGEIDRRFGGGCHPLRTVGRRRGRLRA